MTHLTFWAEVETTIVDMAVVKVAMVGVAVVEANGTVDMSCGDKQISP